MSQPATHKCGFKHAPLWDSFKAPEVDERTQESPDGTDPFVSWNLTATNVFWAVSKTTSCSDPICSINTPSSCKQMGILPFPEPGNCLPVKLTIVACCFAACHLPAVSLLLKRGLGTVGGRCGFWVTEVKGCSPQVFVKHRYCLQFLKLSDLGWV